MKLKERLQFFILAILSIALLTGCGSLKKISLPTVSNEQSELNNVSSQEAIKYSGLSNYLFNFSAETLSDINKNVSTKKTEKSIQVNEKVASEAVSLLLPDNFSIEKDESLKDTYKISVNDIVIGECRFNNLKQPQFTKSTQKDSEIINEKLAISNFDTECKYNDETWKVPVVRICLKQPSDKNTVVIYIREDIISYDQAREIAVSMSFNYLPVITRAGEKNYSEDTCRILILGNSFIISSEIENILQEILIKNNKKLAIDVESMGGAIVASFADRYDILKKIKSGDYDLIFLCGFYSECSSKLKIMLDEKSKDSKLIIFPAHNEDKAIPYECFFQYPETGLADWKGFIDHLIADGMDGNRLYVDDYYHHSTNLAGYAGACLIYSFIYKSIPEPGTAETNLADQHSRQFGLSREIVLSDLSDIRQQAYNFLYK